MKSIKIREADKKFLKPLIRSVQVAQDGVVLAQEIYTRAQKLLWKTLKEEYPEIEGRRATFEHPEDKDWELLVYGKAKSLPEMLMDAKELDERIKKLEEAIEKKTEKIAETVTQLEEPREEKLTHEDLEQAYEEANTESGLPTPPKE